MLHGGQKSSQTHKPQRLEKTPIFDKNAFTKNDGSKTHCGATKKHQCNII